MASAILCGTAGSVTGPDGASQAHYWEVNRMIDIHDVTVMAASGGGWHDKKGCLTRCDGLVRTYGKPEIPDGTTASVSLLTGAGGHTISGTAYVSSTMISTPVDGVVEYEMRLQFTGVVSVNAT